MMKRNVSPGHEVSAEAKLLETSLLSGLFLDCEAVARTGVIDEVACAALRRPYQICGTYGLKYLVAVAVTIIGFLCV